MKKLQIQFADVVKVKILKNLDLTILLFCQNQMIGKVFIVLNVVRFQILT